MGKSKKGGGPWKGIAFIGAIVTIFSVLAYYISASLGAWWQLTISIGSSSETGYMDAFGMYHPEGQDVEMVLGMLGIFSGILLILGSVLVLFGALGEKKIAAIGGVLIMIGGFALWIYALYNIDTTGSLAQFLQALDSSDEYFIHWGEMTIWFIVFSWRMGTGFFLAIVGIIISLIGSFKLDF